MHKLYAGVLCKTEDCTKAAIVKDLCRMHYVKAKRRQWPNVRERHMYSLAKQRARKKGLEFDLAATDIVIPATCPILGIPLVHGKKILTDNSPTLDRVDSTKGYVKGNVHVISYIANRIKFHATTEQLMKVALFMQEWDMTHA